MTMTIPQNANELMATIETDTEIERVETKAVALLQRAETEVQLDAAHRYPRSVKKFLSEAMMLATISQEVAESCMYAMPRGGKTISGPSVRLAEICASSYGNMHIGARVIDVTDKEVVSQGVAWDIEKNLRVSVETRRRITNKNGRRYDDDMITMTGNAAASIALRNAIFRVVPKAYVEIIYAKARQVAVGDAQTFVARRDTVLERLGLMGATADRILAKLERRAVEDITMEDVETLIGLGTAVKEGDLTVDDAFPAITESPVSKEQDGKRVKLPGSKAAPKQGKKEVAIDDKTGEVREMPKMPSDMDLPLRQPGED